ncbi:MAG: SDR family NAD(P)-dependent oxidoreductase [Burkholderiaceae bacterium]
MKNSDRPLALIVGVGDGVSASLARLLAANDYQIALASRQPAKFAALSDEIQARSFICDCSQPNEVDQLFDALGAETSRLAVVICNPSARVRGSITELDPDAVRQAVEVTAFGSFLVGRRAAAAMLDQAPEDGVRGTILFTGASAGVKGFPRSATFAMGKFAQRGLAESMARELHPQGIHVAWINIDGGIANPNREGRAADPARPDAKLDPDAIALSYLGLINQHRSAWSNELAIRPWVETF